jgi:hypothetical protein
VLWVAALSVAIFLALLVSRTGSRIGLSGQQRLLRTIRDYQSADLLSLGFMRDMRFHRPKTAAFPFGADAKKLRETLMPHAGDAEEVSANQLVLDALRFFTDKTPFEESYALNELPSADKLTLLLVTNDPSDLTQGQGCAFIGHLNTIVCDLRYLEQRFREIDSIEHFYVAILIDITTGQPRPILPKEVKRIHDEMKQALLLWIIGHEIGHVIKHGTGFRHRYEVAELTGSDVDLREVEADDFVADKLVGGHKPGQSYAATLITATNELMEHEYRKYVPLADQARVDATGSTEVAGRVPIVVPFNRYNMPLVVRLVRIQEAITRRLPGVDDTGHHLLAKAGITLVESVYVPHAVWLILALIVVTALGSAVFGKGRLRGA